MSWLIRVGSTGFERCMNSDVTPSLNCSVTSTLCHTVAQLTFDPDVTSGKAGSNPACQVEKVWRNVVASLVGV